MAWERDTLESLKLDDYGKIRTTIEKVCLKLILGPPPCCSARIEYATSNREHTEYRTQYAHSKQRMAHSIQRAWYTACTVETPDISAQSHRPEP